MKKLAWFLLASNFILVLIVLLSARAIYDDQSKILQRVDYLTKLTYEAQ